MSARWTCEGCGQDIPEGEVLHVGVSIGRYHLGWRCVSAGGGMIGCRADRCPCGPVKRRKVSLQEKFLEWCGYL